MEEDTAELANLLGATLESQSIIDLYVEPLEKLLEQFQQREARISDEETRIQQTIAELKRAHDQVEHIVRDLWKLLKVVDG